MNTYIKEENGIKTEFTFVESKTLPDNINISTPITFAFIGQNLVIVEKNNGWWDIVGGKIEEGEFWEDALRREAKEEAGVDIDYIEIIGYVHAKNEGDISSINFPKENILPVTTSFVKKVDKDWEKRETLSRDAIQKNEVKKLFKLRGDNDQLLDMFSYAFNEYNSRNYEYKFEYFSGDNHDDYPNTQSVTFVRIGDEFIVVKEKGGEIFSLPGGGCHMDEASIDCAIRETMEEAQVSIKDIEKIGVVIVSVIKDGVVLSTSMQTRYLANVDEMSDFVPEKDGYEMVERKLVSFEYLEENILLLKNDTGVEILKDLKKLL